MRSEASLRAARTVRRLRRVIARTVAARAIIVSQRNGIYRIEIHEPTDGRTSHTQVLPRFLRTRDEFANLQIVCNVCT